MSISLEIKSLHQSIRNGKPSLADCDQTLAGSPGWNQNDTLGTLGISDPFNSSNTQNCGYVYDDLARINSVNCMNGSTNVFNQSFTLDPFGNISKSGSISFAASYLLSNGTTNNQEQSVGSCVPTYDANGNMTKDCSFSSPPKYTWDSDGNPVQVRSSSLTFDALDREVEYANGSAITQVLYGPIGKMGLMNGQTPSITRIPLPGGSTAKMVGTSGVTYILHNDWLGSCETYDRLQYPLNVLRHRVRAVRGELFEHEHLYVQPRFHWPVSRHNDGVV